MAIPYNRNLLPGVSWYSALIVMGILCAILLAEKEERRRKLPKDTIIDLAKRGATMEDERALVEALIPGLRATEKLVGERCRDLAQRLQMAIGRGRPLTDLGDRVATPLQTQRLAVGL